MTSEITVDLLSHQNDESASSRPQVLIMIADPILDRVYRSVLQSPQYCTVWCDDGNHWKETLLAFPYDVIVIDFSMFPENPIDCLLAIKKLAPEAELIVISDTEDVRIAIGAFQTGISDYFMKPASPEGLAWAIEKIARRRALHPSNALLNADLEVFSAAHHISMSESDGKMRTLAMKHLCQVLHASGGLWAWPSPTTQENTEGFPFPVEILQGSREAGSGSLDEFRRRHQDWLEHSADGGVTSHPEDWVHGEFAWIPLRTPWMGGVFLHGITEKPDPSTLARAEFLIRNTEISLENYRRYVEVKQMTYVDELTGLYNSRYLDIAVESAVEDFRKSNAGFSVLFIDVDHFKKVNDTHGHLVGSQLLIDMAHTLKAKMRKPDHLFRYGGDEFIVVMYGVNTKQAIETAERLRAEIETKRFFINNKEVRVTLSIGVASFPEHGRETKTIIQLADDAMYSGKKSGRNSVFIAGLLQKSLPTAA